MDMGNCRPRFRGINAVVSDMFRGDRIIRMLALIIVPAAHRAGQDNFVRHLFGLPGFVYGTCLQIFWIFQQIKSLGVSDQKNFT